MEREINKEHIFDYLGNKTSPIQRKAVEDWLLDRENEELYYQWLEEWERNHLQYIPDTKKALDTFFSQTIVYTEPDTEQNNVLNSQENRLWRTFRWASAAVVLLTLTSGWFWRESIMYKSYRTGYGEVAEYRLPDGSDIKLNANSYLRIPRWGFGEQTREVFLSGEAAFNVKHLENHQRFVVKTIEDFEVEVLGTEFIMTARKYGSRVILTTGKVNLRYQANEEKRELEMMPGDLVTLSKNQEMKIRKTDTPENFTEWEESRFYFEETQLEEIGYMLQENYGLEVEFSGPEVSGRMLMGSFKGQTVDDLLVSIAEVLDISVARKGDKVLFSDK